MLSSHSLPDWCEQLTFSAPFLFPFETRQLYFYCTAFGSSRYSQDPGREWVYLESVFWSKYIIFGSGFKNLPLIWIRIRASSGLRQKITNILITVFSFKKKYKKYVQKLNLKKVPNDDGESLLSSVESFSPIFNCADLKVVEYYRVRLQGGFRSTLLFNILCGSSSVHLSTILSV